MHEEWGLRDQSLKRKEPWYDAHMDQRMKQKLKVLAFEKLLDQNICNRYLRFEKLQKRYIDIN